MLMILLEKPVLNVLISALAVFAIAYFNVIPGLSVTPYAAIIIAILIGALNLIVRPLLVLAKVPIILFTYWLFTVVINTVIFWFIATFVNGVNIENLYATEGFLISTLMALMISAVQSITQKVLEW